MSVDNRYTGVGYEPPFETPSDKDFMDAHIEELESRVRELEERIKVSDEHFKESVEMYMETINGLESRVRELEENLKLSAKSYDANSKGWQADIVAAKERIKGLEKENGEMRVLLTTRVDANRLSEANERIKVLEDALKDALYSMGSLCQYSEDHKEGIAIVSNALEVK